MDLISSLNNLVISVNEIDTGRNGFTIPGKEVEGRISFENGISTAMSVFKDAYTTADCEAIILTELTFLQQELQYCSDTNKAVYSSLARAIVDFNDSLNCLKIVKDKKLYKVAAATYLTSPKECVQGMPNDAVQQTCKSHLTRLQNVLKTPGMNPLERTAYDQRIANIAALKNAYLALQKKALT
jgi:hypothetical protein